MPEFVPHFQDYKVQVVDVAFLDDEVIKKFTSDFKLIARFFKNRRLGVEDWDDNTQVEYVEAFFDFIAAFTTDSRYQNVKEDLEKIKAKGEKVAMNDPYLDMLLENRLKRKAAEVEAQTEERFSKLINCLLSDGDMDTMKQVLVDREVRAKLYVKYGIDDETKNEESEEVVRA